MHQAQSRGAAGVLQIQEVGAHLIGQQQTFVDDGAAAHAGHVVLFAVLELERLNGRTGRFTDHIELALQRVLHDDIGTAANEHLTNDRLFGAHTRRHRHLGVDRHIAPAQQHLAFGGNGALHFLLASQAAGVFFGQKNHTHAVLTLRRQGHPLHGHVFAVQRIRQLNQDACAVAHELVGAHGTPVIQVFQNLQCLTHDGVRLVALDVGHKTHTTSVVLVGRVVQTVLLEVLLIGCRRHGMSFIKMDTKIACGRAYRTATSMPKKINGVRYNLIAASADMKYK